MPTNEDKALDPSVGNVKIKQEKITPPSTPSAAAGNSDLADNLLDNVLGDRKPEAVPLKSSNEILADLFKVFNAPPPALDSNDDSTEESAKKKHKKKHKKEKKAKKHKKRGTESDGSSKDSAEAGKLKKVKKEKKRDKRKSDNDDDNAGDDKSHKKRKKSKDKEKSADKSEIVIKKEKIDKADDSRPKSDETKVGGKAKSETIVSIKQESTTKKSPDEKTKRQRITGPSSDETKKSIEKIQVSVSTSDPDGVVGRRKIVIKSLVNSAVYQNTLKEVDIKKAREKEREKEKEKEKERLKEREREKRKHSRRRSKSNDKPNEKRRRTHSSSLSLSDEETYLRERERRYNKESRDLDKDDFYGDSHRGRDRERDRDRKDKSTNRSRDDRGFRSSFYRHEHDRRRSRSQDRFRNSEDRIDKKRLLEIARKNAITMLKNGTLPGTQNLAPEAKEKALAKMRYGGKSVDELTEFCKKLSQGEANGYLSNVSGDSDVDADLEKPFHHPFVLKDRGPIVMNIKNATPIPPKTSEQTKAILMQFPVSSGQHHRLNESEWVPVEPPKPVKKVKEPQEQPVAITVTPSVPVAPVPAPVAAPTADVASIPTPSDPQPVPMPVEPPASCVPIQTNTYAQTQSTLAAYQVQTQAAIVPQPVPAVQHVSTPQPSNDSIFPEATGGKDLDVTSIITQRLNAMRKLQENPLDSEALKLMYNTQKDMSAWANSKFVPGQFTGSTGANILSTKELSSGFQAWAKRDQLLSTTPVSGGMGMHLLQKMGWKPGEGLGKEKNGSLQPLLLEVKLDKKGLVAEEESPEVQRQRAKQAKKIKAAATLKAAKEAFESKHPVSLLGELSAKRKFGAPLYELVMQEGPSHQRQFLFRVSINGQHYQPNMTSLNKKEAKAVAARFALQQMGILSEPPANPGAQPMAGMPIHQQY